MSETKLLEIPLNQIRPNAVASLRPVHTDTEEFEQMVDSIKEKGILASISVRPAVDPETKEEYYELIDGLHRCTAAREAGLDTIPATIHSDMNDSDVLEAQLIANAHKIETKPAEYSKHLERILTVNPMMTEAELASKLAKSTQWLRDRLRINSIEDEKILKLINDGKICLNNAASLAKLPEEEREDWLQRAVDKSAQEFVPEAQARVKEIKDAIRKGKEAAPAEFKPQPHAQKVSTLKQEMTESKVGPILINELGVTDPVEAFRLAIQWTLHMDPKSLESSKAEFEQKQQEAAQRKAKLAKERADKKAKKAKEAADKAAAGAAEAATSHQKIIYPLFDFQLFIFAFLFLLFFLKKKGLVK